MRTLFLSLLLIWCTSGFWGVGAGRDTTATIALAVSTGGLLGWLYLGYRRETFPFWSWLPESLCVVLVAGQSGYGVTVLVVVGWVGFRALYGTGRQRIAAAAVSSVVLGGGLLAIGEPFGDVVPLLSTALMSLGVGHVLANRSQARDRATVRESAMASAGAGLAAAVTRTEAMEVTLGSALALDPAILAALILTRAGGTVHVVAAAGDVGTEAEGWITELDRLPESFRAAMHPGGYAPLAGDDALKTFEVLRMPAQQAVLVAAMATQDEVIGALVVTLDHPAADDLAQSFTTLAGEAALTLDQLLVRSRLAVVVDHTPDALVLASEAGSIRFVNPAAERLLGRSGDDMAGQPLWSLLHPDDVPRLFETASEPGVSGAVPCRMRGVTEAPWLDVEANLNYANEHDGSHSIVFNARDISERNRLELELRHAQKLESVGRLASGIAHEINTPIQFVGDNVRFLQTSMNDLDRLLAAYRTLAATVRAGGDAVPIAEEAAAIAEEIDIEFVVEEVPMAVTQSLEGISRVAGIVRAMKAFGHPGTEQKTLADLNDAIRNTLVVANNELKYVADVTTDLGEIPPVLCHLGDINQVVLNLVVNAAHAISAAGRGRGTITVSTRQEGDEVTIGVSDTGTGVPPEIADKLFEPFFTTKEVGTGTGQGLSLVRALVRDRHHGVVDFVTEYGAGTTFTVRLPLAPDQAVELTGAAS